MKTWARRVFVAAFLLVIAVAVAGIVNVAFEAMLGDVGDLSAPIGTWSFWMAAAVYIVRVALTGWLAMNIGCAALERMNRIDRERSTSSDAPG